MFYLYNFNFLLKIGLYMKQINIIIYEEILGIGTSNKFWWTFWGQLVTNRKTNRIRQLNGPISIHYINLLLFHHLNYMLNFITCEPKKE